MPTRLLNRSEEATYLRLCDVAESNSAQVFPKIRIADVLPINGSGVSDDLFGFGLKAHFDFVVADAEYAPLFAVEFDGPYHAASDDARERDKKKNSLCDRFDFPLLRINSRYIDVKYRGMDLLTYFANVWFLAKGFYEAQSQGAIPYDEPFDPAMIISDPKHKRRWPYWLSAYEQVYIQRLHEAGRIAHPCTSDWVGADAEDNYRCIAWIQVAPDAYLMTQTGMRNQQFPVIEADILQQLAIFDIRREIDRYLSDGANAVRREVVDGMIEHYQSAYDMRASCTVGSIR